MRDRHLSLSDQALLGECEVDRFRASGPGGQKRNKTDSAVRLRHQPTGVVAAATESRSQHENRARALRRLRERIALDLREDVAPGEYRPPPELRALVTGGRPRGEKARRTVEYLTAAAHLLDLMAASDCSIADSARRLGVSTGALSRLITNDERLLRKANEMRAARGLKPLR